MNGLATKKALRHIASLPEGIPDVVHNCAPGTERPRIDLAAEDAAYAFRHGRARDRIMGYAPDDFALPDRPFMPNFSAGLHDRHAVTDSPRHDRHGSSLGTPGEARRSRAARIERAWRTAFAIGIALALALAALWAIYAPPGAQPQPVRSGVAYFVKAQHLAPGQRACELDPHEGCLVCMHRAAAGQTLVSTHC